MTGKKPRQSIKEQFALRAAGAVLVTAEGKRTQLGLTFESEREMSGKLRKAGTKRERGGGGRKCG